MMPRGLRHSMPDMTWIGSSVPTTWSRPMMRSSRQPASPTASCWPVSGIAQAERSRIRSSCAPVPARCAIFTASTSCGKSPNIRSSSTSPHGAVRLPRCPIRGLAELPAAAKPAEAARPFRRCHLDCAAEADRAKFDDGLIRGLAPAGPARARCGGPLPGLPDGAGNPAGEHAVASRLDDDTVRHEEVDCAQDERRVDDDPAALQQRFPEVEFNFAEDCNDRQVLRYYPAAVPAVAAEDACDRPPSVQPDRLSGRANQVGCQGSEFTQSPRPVCALYPVDVLARRQPAVGCGLAEQRDDPVAFDIGGTKISRRRAVGHSLKILQPQVTCVLPAKRCRIGTIGTQPASNPESDRGFG